MRERWTALCRRLGRKGDAAAWFTVLEGLHANPPRAYHNLGHVAECLEMLDTVREHTDSADSVEFALWFHDCVYVPGRSDNEERSAEIARVCAGALGRSDAWASAVTELIMTTRHTTPPSGADAEWIADIDMSVLAAPTPRYLRYAAAIRTEYDFVPHAQFQAGRAAFLRGLLLRPAIYHTPLMRSKQEALARANLSEELKGLESRA